MTSCATFCAGAGSLSAIAAAAVPPRTTAAAAVAAAALAVRSLAIKGCLLGRRRAGAADLPTPLRNAARALASAPGLLRSSAVSSAAKPSARGRSPAGVSSGPSDRSSSASKAGSPILGMSPCAVIGMSPSQAPPGFIVLHPPETGSGPGAATPGAPLPGPLRDCAARSRLPPRCPARRPLSAGLPRPEVAAAPGSR